MNITVVIFGEPYTFDINTRQSYRISRKISSNKDEIIYEISNDGNTINIKVLTSGFSTYSSAYPSGQVCPRCNGSGKI